MYACVDVMCMHVCNYACINLFLSKEVRRTSARVWRICNDDLVSLQGGLISLIFYCLGNEASWSQFIHHTASSACAAFHDNNIRDDLTCALRVYREHQRMQGNGFKAW